MKRLYYISLGSNMGDRAGYLSRAAEMMEAAGIRIAARSSLYETLPWGKEDQALFLNAVIAAEWDGEPEALMRALLAVEAENGRVREVHWGPRTLDLDILFCEGTESDTALLHLPHPYFWDRAFVLVPLSEIAPDFCFRGEMIEARLRALDAARAVRLWNKKWEKEK